MKKTLFLDIDGVLATSKEYNRVRTKFWGKYDAAKQLRIPYPYNPDCVRIFNEISDACDFDIVISSDWKSHWTLEELKEIFKFNKIDQMPIDTTSVNTSQKYFSRDLESERLDEIKEYIKKHEIKGYLILDDLRIDNIIDESDKDSFILTRDNEGLKQSNLKKKIIKYLNQEP